MSTERAFKPKIKTIELKRASEKILGLLEVDERKVNAYEAALSLISTGRLTNPAVIDALASPRFTNRDRELRDLTKASGSGATLSFDGSNLGTRVTSRDVLPIRDAEQRELLKTLIAERSRTTNGRETAVSELQAIKQVTALISTGRLTNPAVIDALASPRFTNRDRELRDLTKASGSGATLSFDGSNLGTRVTSRDVLPIRDAEQRELLKTLIAERSRTTNGRETAVSELQAIK